MSAGLPTGWGACKLGELAAVLDNQRVPVNSAERQKRQGAIPYFGATGQVGWIDDFLFNEELVLLGEDGAPFFDKSKPIAYIIQDKSWVNNHAHVLRAIEGITTNRFLKYVLDATNFEEFVNGTTRLKLTQGAMVNIPVKLPPLAEQKRIVERVEALLTEVNATKARLDRVPLILKRFRQAVLAAACSGKLTEEWRDGRNLEEWKSQKLEGLLTEPMANGRSVPDGNGFPVLRLTALKQKRVDLSERKLGAWNESDAIRFLVKKGDFLVARGNGSLSLVGRGALVIDEPDPVAYPDTLIRIRPNLRVLNPQYLALVWNSPQTRAQIEGAAHTTAGIHKVSQKDLASIELPIPSINEQEEIVRQVSVAFTAMESVSARVEKAMRVTDKLPQAILSKAFRGELVPTEAELARAEGRTYETAEQLLARIRSGVSAEPPKKARLKAAAKGGRAA